jgi:hypothetical protein
MQHWARLHNRITSLFLMPPLISFVIIRRTFKLANCLGAISHKSMEPSLCLPRYLHLSPCHHRLDSTRPTVAKETNARARLLDKISRHNLSCFQIRLAITHTAIDFVNVTSSSVVSLLSTSSTPTSFAPTAAAAVVGTLAWPARPCCHFCYPWRCHCR